MTEVIALSCGPMTCAVSPQAGGVIASLAVDSIPILAPITPDLIDAELGPTRERRIFSSGSYCLVPYSNRIANAKLQWAGRHYPLRPNFAPEHHAIHGVGWQAAWQVEAVSAQSVALIYEHNADENWPFAFSARQTIELTADGLEQQLSLTNRASMAIPAGLGWHPYFVKRPGCSILFAARQRWDMDETNLPTLPRAHAGLNQACQALQVDHCFSHCTGSVLLSDALVVTTVESTLAHRVIYTDPSIDVIAIEPVSHVNNAFNLFSQGRYDENQLGILVLQPNQTISGSMKITSCLVG